jgi:tmRNA-binding protein
VKIEIALAKGKHNFDKKKTLKEKDIARETQRTIKSVQSGF